MPNRRMFSRKICRSAKFLKMPGEAQRLYFHLGLDADDDGVVEAYSVMKAIDVKEEFFNILVEKGYVIVLNDDLVSYIVDWREHNVIRADRKTDSIYKELLLKTIPDVKLVEARKRSTGKKKSTEEEKGQTNDSQDGVNGQAMDSPNKNLIVGQTMDSPKADNGQHKLSQDKLSEVNTIKESLNKENISEDNLSEVDEKNKTNKDYKKIKIIFENSLENITKEEIEECLNYLNYFQIELVEYALIKTSMVKSPTWQYTKTILNNWLAKGINTLEKVKQEERAFKKQNSTKANTTTANSENKDTGFKRKGEELLNGN